MGRIRGRNGLWRLKFERDYGFRAVAEEKENGGRVFIGRPRFSKKML